MNKMNTCVWYSHIYIGILCSILWLKKKEEGKNLPHFITFENRAEYFQFICKLHTHEIRINHPHYNFEMDRICNYFEYAKIILFIKNIYQSYFENMHTIFQICMFDISIYFAKLVWLVRQGDFSVTLILYLLYMLSHQTTFVLRAYMNNEQY